MNSRLDNLRNQLNSSLRPNPPQSREYIEQARQNPHLSERMRERDRLRVARSPRQRRSTLEHLRAPRPVSRGEYIQPRRMRSPRRITSRHERRPEFDPLNPFRRTYDRGNSRPAYPSSPRAPPAPPAPRAPPAPPRSPYRSPVNRPFTREISDEIDRIRERTEARARAREREDLNSRMGMLTIDDGPPPMLSLPPTVVPREEPSSAMIRDRWRNIWDREERQRLVKYLTRLTNRVRDGGVHYEFMSLPELKNRIMQAHRLKDRAQRARLRAERNRNRTANVALRKRMHDKASKNIKKIKDAARKALAARKASNQKIKALNEENAARAAAREAARVRKSQKWVLKNPKKSGDAFKYWTIVREFFDKSSDQTLLVVRAGASGNIKTVEKDTFEKNHMRLESPGQGAGPPGQGAGQYDFSRVAESKEPVAERESKTGEIRLERRTNSKGQLEVQAPEGEGPKRTGKWYVAHGKIGKALIAKYEKR